MIKGAEIFIDLTENNLGSLNDAPITHSRKYFKDIASRFANAEAAAAMEQNTLFYKVSAWLPVPEGRVEGLFYGLSCVHPGTVGSEFFMTKGHFHAERDTSEFYWGLGSSGLLLFIGEECRFWAERGSLHYIQANVAHRLINTGEEIMRVAACWPSNAGHDYESIIKRSFATQIFATKNDFELREQT